MILDISCGAGKFGVPLERVIKKSVTIGDRTRVREFIYEAGFGLDDVSIEVSAGYRQGMQNIHVVSSKTDRAYYACLPVQHVVAESYVPSVEGKLSVQCWKICLELCIRKALLSCRFPVPPETDLALWGKHIPAKKRGRKRTEGYMRYYLYRKDENGKIEIYETDMDGAGEYFSPEVADILSVDKKERSAHDIFIIRLAGHDYSISRTDIMPIGGEIIGADGKLLPVEVIGSRSRNNIASFHGLYGRWLGEDCGGIQYYTASVFMGLQDIGKSGIVRAVHAYRVSPVIPGDSPVSPEQILPCLSSPVVKLTGFTVLPPVFKYLREWANTAGRMWPAENGTPVPVETKTEHPGGKHTR